MWYVSYGSNLSAARFRAYLCGGRPPGRATTHVGARDRSQWREDRPLTIGHRLFFAGESRWWGGGGVAFIDPDPTPGGRPTLARAYLITGEQFQDVLAQESGREVGTEIDLAGVLSRGRDELGVGRYDLVLRVGERNGVPLVTFTTPRPVDELAPNPPSESYAEVLRSGLMESHGIDETRARTYLAPFSDPAG